MKPPPPNPQVQKEFLDALIYLCVECGISFSALSGPAFNKDIFDDDEDISNQEILEDSTDDEFDVVFDSIVI